jgi:Icc-related predicted phosphoesterase
MRIWHISDTHTFHGYLKVPDGIDMVIFSGDCSNPREPSINEQEVRNFITWYASLPIKYKIFVAGNHDTSIEAGYITKDNFVQAGIIHLENESIEIEGLKIWGSPYTPSFGYGWAYNKKRSSLHDLWQTIPEDTDIVVIHGPPAGILDLSYDRDNRLEMCGCAALRKRMRALKPRLVCFGHIHNMTGIENAGYISYSDERTIYSNGTVVWDGRFDKGATSNGNIFSVVK